MYENCRLCPNLCGVDRRVRTGICGQRDSARIAWAGLHRGEEPPVTGAHGSGMIFFTGCPLHCRYCQNHQISGAHGSNMGFTVSDEELAELMLALERQKAASLNLVTVTHFIPSIINALEIAKKKGFSLPVVWNTSGYESIEGLKLIDPYVDLYLTDLKSLDEKVSEVFCGRKAYKDAIIPVMDFIVKHHPVTDLDCLKGTIVRHLVFPGTLGATLDVLKYYRDHYMKHCFLSIMVQFVPPRENDEKFAPMSDMEYDILINALEELGIEDGFIQERGDEILWIPDFRKDCPFPRSFADVNEYFLSLKRERGL